MDTNSFAEDINGPSLIDSTDPTLKSVTSPVSGSGSSGGQSAASVTVSNMDELKTKEPKLYKMITQAIAESICDELKNHAERMKALYRQNTAQST